MNDPPPPLFPNKHVFTWTDSSSSFPLLLHPSRRREQSIPESVKTPEEAWQRLQFHPWCWGEEKGRNAGLADSTRLKSSCRKSAEIHEELNPSPCKQNQATHWLVSSSGSERDQALSCQPSHRSGAGSGCQVGCPPCHGRPQPVQFWLLVESGLHSRGLFNLQSTVHGAFLDPTFQRAGTTLSFLLLHS